MRYGQEWHLPHYNGRRHFFIQTVEVGPATHKKKGVVFHSHSSQMVKSIMASETPQEVARQQATEPITHAHRRKRKSSNDSSVGNTRENISLPLGCCVRRVTAFVLIVSEEAPRHPCRTLLNFSPFQTTTQHSDIFILRPSIDRHVNQFKDNSDRCDSTENLWEKKNRRNCFDFFSPKEKKRKALQHQIEGGLDESNVFKASRYTLEW